MPYILIAFLIAIGVLGAFLKIKDKVVSKQDSKKEDNEHAQKPQ